MSELDNIISPEIINDDLYHIILKLAAETPVQHILEIGSSSGGGSTEAFVRGIKQNASRPLLHCMEISTSRFKALQERYQHESQVHCLRSSSVGLKNFPTQKELSLFYHYVPTALNNFPLETIQGWLQQDIDYLHTSMAPENGIRMIKEQFSIDQFGIVLIDGSEFLGKAELDEIYGAKIIIFDDINGFKNYHNHQRLLADPHYKLLSENIHLRNGYSVFIHSPDTQLPIHFLTIVLNGEPFIRHHIDVFKHLPFPWHWHIVEGVADLVNDTAWSVASGGRITDEVHRNGLSNDGTSDYIDELARLFPDNITVYRKSGGQFWNGKLEMVNAPLANIKEECLLWQVDSDELWDCESIERLRQLFIQQPDKTAAYCYCDYFVGPQKYVSSLNTWATRPYEWLRVWRFQPTMRWSAHEPPTLVTPQGINVASIAPISRDDTVHAGVTFQHFAYAVASQVRFKEIYYGYPNAVRYWQKLQQTRGPVNLADYLPWALPDAITDDWPDSAATPIAERLFKASLSL